MRLSAICPAALAVVGWLLSAPSAAADPGPVLRPVGNRENLRAAMQKALSQRPLAAAKVGVQVVNLTTGEVLFSHNADELLNPASNMKLVTSAAALTRLGPEYRYATDFACGAPLKAGACETLYIRGRGDPSLFTERLWGIVGELAHRGLKSVGDIVVDDTYFDAVREGPGWEQERSDKAYMAPSGALSINHNTVAIYVLPGETEKQPTRIELEPPSNFFVVENLVKTASKKARQRIVPFSIAAGDRQRIRVSGRVPAGREPQLFYKRIDNPPRYAGETIRALLKLRGVNVRGKVRAGVTPRNVVMLHVALSPPLAELLRDINKMSNNFAAEQLLRTLGAEVKGAPGTWAKGAAAVEQFLAELGIPKGSTVVKNGSGLNDTNRVSAAQLVKLLSVMATRNPAYVDYASSLGIAGKDGTLHARMVGTAAEGRLRGKTGTLEKVTALSGYVTLTSGELCAYAILVNDLPGRQGAVAALDQMAIAVASGGAPAPEPPQGVPLKLSELQARIGGYSAMCRQPDRRSVGGLRVALGAEGDAVLRSVIVDTLYRCDRAGAGSLAVDVWPATAEEQERLRSVSRELGIAPPLVSVLIDLAADGSSDAIDRVLGWALPVRGDATLSSQLADGLEEIGRNAPDELGEALGRAPEATRSVVAELLVKGIAATPERGAHPFLERLKALPAATPGFSAAALYDRLHRAVVEKSAAEGK